MACIASPPPEVAAIIQVGPGPTYPLTVRAADSTSANYLVNNKGDWDFSCFKGPIRVRLAINTSGVVFYYGGGKDTLSFSDDEHGTKQPVGPGHHQFPGGPQHVTAQSMWFTYHNDQDGGQGDHQDRYPRSAYGLFFGDAAGNFLTQADPIIQNGGSNN
jgi:hypothetical protein